jgi:hypothetical protein
MTTFTTPEQYNDYLVNTLTKISLEDYFKAYHEQFYPEQDISFMDFFIEISAKKHEFCIPRTKLFEYGVMTECTSTNVLARMTNQNLKNEVNYQETKVCSLRSQGGISEKIIYMMKPKAFKKLLMRAGKNSKQTIDVEIYADYYLLLEDVYIDYTSYERAYSKKIMETKDSKIDQQSDKIDTLITLTTNQTNTISKQDAKIDRLLKFAEETKDELHEVKLELVDIKVQLHKILTAVISLAYLPHIYKRFYERDHGTKKIKDGKPFSLTSVSKTKTLVFVATYTPLDNQLKIECVNRKLSEPLIQVNKIISRAKLYNNQLAEAYCDENNLEQILTDDVYDALINKFQSVFMPQSYGVSTLNEQEVRSNYSKLDSNAFKSFGVTKFSWSTKYKAMIFEGIDSFESAQKCFHQFIDMNQTNNIHSYDQSLEESINKSGEILSPEALDELKRRNNEFAYESKAIIDMYYRKTYVCDDHDLAYLRLRNNPKTTLLNLKDSLRDLVVTGLDFA